MRSLLLLAALAGAHVASAANWAVIVAGSKGYDNYRHQADACHAYQVVSQGGVPKENIIMMMQDDVAGSTSNPFPGKLFNKPSTGPGRDVYAGCNIDYRGDIVTAQLFLDVIQGNAAAVEGKGNGKVLKSTEKDHVFINFVDHGGTGLIAFPNGPFLYADDLQKALQSMSDKNMYERLVFYMEACESGSMFSGLLPTNTSIYATTAADPNQSSWGTFCPPNDVVDGKNLNTCLGDLYSVNWLEDADKRMSGESLEKQYTVVKEETTKSQVMQYGDQQFTSEAVADYIAPGGKSLRSSPFSRLLASADDADLQVRLASAVSSRDISLHLRYYGVSRASSELRTSAAAALRNEMDHREHVDALFSRVRNAVLGVRTLTPTDATPRHFGCLKETVAVAEDRCGAFTDYSLKHVRTLSVLCGVENGRTERIVQALSAMC